MQIAAGDVEVLHPIHVLPPNAQCALGAITVMLLSKLPCGVAVLNVNVPQPPSFNWNRTPRRPQIP